MPQIAKDIKQGKQKVKETIPILTVAGSTG